MMMSSLHLRLRLIFASACITHNALEKWSKASDRSCVFVWWVRRFSRLFLIDWLIRPSLSTVVCSAGQAKCSGVDGDSGIGAASYSWRTACGGGGVSSDWIQLLISQQTSGQLHHSHVNCVCSELVSEGRSHERFHHHSHWFLQLLQDQTLGLSAGCSQTHIPHTGYESRDVTDITLHAITRVRGQVCAMHSG